MQSNVRADRRGIERKSAVALAQQIAQSIVIQPPPGGE